MCYIEMSAAVGAAGAAATAPTNFTFLDRSTFLSLPDGPPDADTGLPTILLPEGAELYRADSEGAKEPGANVPAFFTNYESSHSYARGKKGALSAYVVKKTARLFDLSLDNLDKPTLNIIAEKLFEKLPNRKDHPVLVNYLDVLKGYVKYKDGDFMTGDIEEPAQYVIPPSFSPSDLEEYRTKKVTHPMYLNRRLAEIICLLGFDGWVVKPYNYDERTNTTTGMLEFSIGVLYRIKEKLEEELATAKNKGEEEAIIAKYKKIPPFLEYMPEIMLCRWKDHMEVKSLSVPNNAPVVAGATGKARRRRTRKYRR